jgi:hypothetical protein
MEQAGKEEVERGFLASRPFVPSSPVSPLRADARDGTGTKGRSLMVIGGPKSYRPKVPSLPIRAGARVELWNYHSR